MMNGIPAAAAARASTTSPRYAESAVMPMGAMPNGAFHSRPSNEAAVVRRETSTRTRGAKPHSAKAARLSRKEASVSAAPET